MFVITLVFGNPTFLETLFRSFCMRSCCFLFVAIIMTFTFRPFSPNSRFLKISSTGSINNFRDIGSPCRTPLWIEIGLVSSDKLFLCKCLGGASYIYYLSCCSIFLYRPCCNGIKSLFKVY